MFSKRIFSVVIVTVLLLGLLLSPARTVVAQTVEEQAAQAPALGNTVIYNLYATDGHVTLADGTRVYTYGFVGGRQGMPLTYLDENDLPVTVATGAPAPTGGPITAAELPLAGHAQFPAPIIYAKVGDVVEIRLKNLGVTMEDAPNDPHSIHLHGLDVNAANDGVPETSVAAVPANADDNIGAGNVVVYMFAPKNPGTYMYHCHQEASIHVQMGMYGALVIYNPWEAGGATGPGTGGGQLWGHPYTRDYVLLLSEFDLRQHVSEFDGSGSFNPVDYKPTYWFINGLSFPNTIHAGLNFNWANWIAAHPGYDPFIVGSVGSVSNGLKPGRADKVLLRVINMGFQAQPMHMHGFHGKIIGSDQRAWTWANLPFTPSGKGLEKNTLLIGSGETYEWLIDFSQQTLNSTYAATSQTRYDPANANKPAANTNMTLPAIPDPFSPGNAYVGGPVVGPAGTQGEGGLPTVLPTVAGQFFPFHNHDDYKATNNGLYPGGMFTMILTTP